MKKIRDRYKKVKKVQEKVEDKAVEEVVEQDVETTETEVVEETTEVVEKATEETVEEVDPMQELQDKLADANEKFLRLHAEYDNFRKRTAKDLRAQRENGVVDTIMPFLQVFDHMKMASMSIENGDNIDAIRQGVTMILNEFKRAIEDLSVEEVNGLGNDFDPNLHEAVAYEESTEVEEGKVLKQWSPGYRKGERLLKPARVVVSSGVAEEEAVDVASEETGSETE